MRSKVLLAVIGLMFAPVAAFAQQLPAGEAADLTRTESYHAGFFSPSGVVRFELIQGRLGLDSPRHRKGSQRREIDGVLETITVTADRGIPSLHYVFQSARQHLTLSVSKARAVRVESWLADAHQRAELVQPDLGPIEMSTRRGDLQETHAGPTLIHLRNADPTSFDQHFGALIQCLLGGQSLDTLSQRAQQAALESFLEIMVSGDDDHPSLSEVRSQVDQLRSPTRAQRVLAQRQLLDWGTPILPALRTIQQDDLDTEQQIRIGSIVAALRPRVSDTPASLAQLLVNDRGYWNTIAHRLSDKQIHLANRYFQQRGLEPIEPASGPAARVASAREP